MNDLNPYSTPQGDTPVPGSLARIAGAGIACAIPLVLIFLCCGGLWFYSRHELLAEFLLSRGTVRIYAEGKVHYEPPGYLYFELLEGDKITISERRFMGIGIERVPAGRFGVIESHDGDFFAIVLENDIKMMHQFSSKSTWPG